jgi:glycosyltransferase involved in cell wall biosynthesis
MAAQNRRAAAVGSGAGTPDLAPAPVYSVIAPVFNEEAGLQTLYDRVRAVMDGTGASWELVLVDDGSGDGSAAVIRRLHSQDPNVRGVSFSRNFGFQAAVTAGLDLARGQAVVLIDADLQDPPEVIPEMIGKWREGYDVVYGVRQQRAGETWFKKVTAAGFYRLIKRMTSVPIPVDTGDFRLMDRTVVEAIRRMPERHRFLRGMVSWVGYRQTGVLYARQPRHAGSSAFTLRKMTRFALDAITSFSFLPLQIAGYVGLGLIGAGLLAGLVLLVLGISGAVSVPVWQALVLFFVVFLGGLQFLFLGILGEYLGRVSEELKARPLYLVGERWDGEEA